VALKSTIYKIAMQITNMDTHYYEDHSITLASHPSENEARLMVRLLAFALNASESLKFGNGLSDPNEADVWEKDLTGDVKLWIDMGQPDEKTILKACGKSEKVKIYSYTRSPNLWWDPISTKLTRAKNLTVYAVNADSVDALAHLVDRSMNLLFSIQDGEIWVRDEKENSVHVIVDVLYGE